MKNNEINQYNIEYYPPLLTADEEKAAVRELELGNPRIKDFFVERNLRIVFIIARRYAGARADFDDLMSVGSIGLIKAIDHFDVSKKIKFATFASQCVRNEMRMYLRRARRKKEISLEETIGKKREGQGNRLEGILSVGGDQVLEELERRESLKEFTKMVGELPQRQQEIIKHRFGMDGREAKTQKEVARILGVSQSCVSKAEHRIVEKMKKSIAPNAKICEKL